jgi:hypothetical protein
MERFGIRRSLVLVSYDNIFLLAVFEVLTVVISIRNVAPVEFGWSAEVWAAWTQAVGSVVAILAAVRIAVWQRKESDKRQATSDALAARSMAANFLPSVSTLVGRLSVECRHASNLVGSTVSPTQIPSDLWDNRGSLHVLGNPGGELLNAVFHIMESRQYISQSNEVASNSLDKYKSSIDAAKKHAAIALGQIRLLFH